MALETRAFDAAEFLETDEAVIAYLKEAVRAAQSESEPGYLAHALGTVARARGMSQIAQAAGLSRESLYKALASGANPEFGTILRVLSALGLQLSITSSDAA